MNGIDISRIMELIAEHPEIIASIKSIAEGTGAVENNRTEPPEDKTDAKETEGSAVTVSAEPEITDAVKGNGGHREKKRHDLLCAIKPYVSAHRGTAIDTVLSLLDIINLLSVR